MEDGHLPVLAEEVMTILSPRPGSLQIDGTLGGGGHTERILEASTPDGRVLGLDADPAAVARVKARLARFGDRLVVRQADFRDVGAVAPAAGFAAVDGLLLDLGLSSFQLADADRGFGIRTGGPLDMRFDTSRGAPASELIADLDAAALASLFRRYGEEPRADRIARAIVRERSVTRIDTAERLAAVVERAAPAAPGRRRIHPATRVFVAAERKGCICPPAIPVCVCGRIPRLRALGPQPVVPTADEVAANPRARSARMRAAERLAA